MKVHFSIATSIFFLFCFVTPTHAAEQVILKVPFTVQAPTALWETEPWANACEETSMVMVNAFYKNEKVDATNAAQKIQEIFAYKADKKIASKDETVTGVAEMIDDLYEWKSVVVAGPTIERITTELDEGHPIIVPLDARVLGAARYDGPVDYHVVVLVGYDQDAKEFLMHDPGINQGELSRIGYETLLRANSKYQIGDTGEESGGEMLFTKPKFNFGIWVRAVWGSIVQWFQ